MKTVINIIRFVLTEIFIIAGFVLLIQTFFGKPDKTIKADAIGYYDYLPALFIHRDFVRKDFPKSKNSSLYDRIESSGVYVDYKDYKVDKYPCGVALLQLPFFISTYLTSALQGDQQDGYQKPFHTSVYHATLFYLFLSIILLKMLLLLYDIEKSVIVFCQLLLVLATPVTLYAHADAGFSHVYSLFAITAFLYASKAFLVYKKWRHFFLACFFAGLIIILRQPNILIILFLPFLAGSLAHIKEGLRLVLTQPRQLLIGIATFVLVSFIQCLLWYLQTGHWLVYSYQGETFNFLDPHFFSILFSYKKGLFLYTPVLILSLFGICLLGLKREYYLTSSWLLFFIILTYILSSWWSWYYGCSFGLRAYIDYLSIFFIPIALLLNRMNLVPKIIICTLATLAIPLNFIQTYQYNNYILHWIDMDKDKYWKVFLKTDKKYFGLVWKSDIDSSLYQTVHEISLGDLRNPKQSNKTVFQMSSLEIPSFDQVDVIQVFIDHEYLDSNNSKIVLGINRKDQNHNYYWHDPYLLHFHEKSLNEWQTGHYNFKFPPISDDFEKIISLEIKSDDQNEFLKNVRLKFLRKLE